MTSASPSPIRLRQDMRLFESDEISILLTPAQAEQLAAALLEAARMSRATPPV